MSLRIAIVHYGEHVPMEEGYRPVRCGRLAEFLTKEGHSVTRISPSFAFAFQVQRPMEWSATHSAEGRSILIPVRNYSNSRSFDRFASIRDFCRGTTKYLAQQPPFDLIISGYPPPGMIRSIRSNSDKSSPIIADIRDLWPDALVPNSRWGGVIEPLMRFIGKVLALELKHAAGVVALSPTMLQRAPKSKRMGVIPIGISESQFDLSAQWLKGERPLEFVFVGSFAPLFDFRSMINGWALFQEKFEEAESARLTIIGGGQKLQDVTVLVSGVPNLTLEGWVEPADIARRLATTDVGLVPTRRGQGTTLSNKVMEYLASGLFVINSLEPDTAKMLTKEGLGSRVDNNATAWANGYSEAMLAAKSIRNSRHDRLDLALEIFGRSVSEKAWLTAINAALEVQNSKSPL